VSDFTKLNLLSKHHPFPIPMIGYMIHLMEEFTFAMVHDINVGYCQIKLDVDAQTLCCIPLGKMQDFKT
jgi:hypothetical protein